MKATIMGEVLPFEVPRHAILATPASTPAPQTWGSAPAPAPSHAGYVNVPLQMVSADTLETMCDNYREAVFSQAMKARPTQILQGTPTPPIAALENLKNLVLPDFIAPDVKELFGTQGVEVLHGALQEIQAFFDSLA